MDKEKYEGEVQVMETELITDDYIKEKLEDLITAALDVARKKKDEFEGSIVFRLSIIDRFDKVLFDMT